MSEPLRTALDEADVLVVRSFLNPRVWVPIPAGIVADQSYALHAGHLREVQRWAASEFGEQGRTYRWGRVNVDTYRMYDVDEVGES